MYNTIYILPERQIHCLQYVGHALHHCGEHSWSERAWRRGLNPAEDYQMNSARPEGHIEPAEPNGAEHNGAELVLRWSENCTVCSV